MDVTKKKNYKKMKDAGFVAVMIGLPILHFIIFYIVVNFNSILLAFRDEYTQAFTFKYFNIFFNEIRAPMSKLRESLSNTLTFFSVSMLAVFPASLIFSYLLYKKIFMYKYLRIVFFLPSIIASVVLVTLYRDILNGPVSGFMKDLLNMQNEPLLLNSSKYALKSILMFQVWLGLGSNMIIYGGTMSRIPQEVIESGRIDGTKFFSELIHISLPLIMPTLSTLLLLNIIGIFGASGPILLFTQGNYGTFTISYWIYDKTIVNPNYNYASAVGIVFTLLGLPIIFTVKYILSKLDKGIEY